MAKIEGKVEEAKGGETALASPLDELLGYRLRRASMATMADILAILRPLGLSAGEASFLILVGANPGCRQSDVGRALEIKRANLTPLVARMKGRGLVADAPIDGRSRSLTLTAEGKALHDKALSRVTAADRKARRDLGANEEALLTALKRIAG
ncbi:MAG: MarR family transcriptional regulator [Sphingobium sp.]|nr:MarR family transcriptional regulator [Sphingobium sp.]